MRKRVPRMFYGETREETQGISNVLSLTSLDIRGSINTQRKFREMISPLLE